MTEGVVIHARANPRDGVRPLTRRLRLARAWQEAGGRATLATQPLPGRLRWQMLRSKVDWRELSATRDTDALAGELCDLMQAAGCRTLVVDDASRELLQALSRLRPAGSLLVVLGVPPEDASIGDPFDLATAHRPEFSVFAGDESSLFQPERLKQQFDRNTSRILVEATRLPPRFVTSFVDQIAIGAFLAEIPEWPVIEVVSRLGSGLRDNLTLSDAKLNSIRGYSGPDRMDLDSASFAWAFFSDPDEFHESMARGQASSLLMHAATCPGHPLDARECGHDSECGITWTLNLGRKDWRSRLRQLLNRIHTDPNAVVQHATEGMTFMDNQGSARICNAIRQVQLRSLGQRTA